MHTVLLPSLLPPDAVDEMTSEEAAAVVRVVRIATGSETEQDLDCLHRAARVWLESNGGVPFERCLRLPTTPDAFRRMQRDVWLCEAAKLINAQSDWEVSTRLFEKWNTFLSRGIWREIRDDPEPPSAIPRLELALFFASRLNRGRSLGERQLYRITRQVFQKKSHSSPNTLGW